MERRHIHTRAAAVDLSRRHLLGLMGRGGIAVGMLGTGALLAGCGGDSSSAGQSAQPSPTDAGPPAQPTGVLRVANPGEPNFIDPANALEITEWSMIRNVYDGLVEWNEDYTELVPALAVSWEVNDDASEWTFQLREGVTFHDSEAFDAAAAKTSLEYYQDKTWGFTLENLDSIEVVESHLLVVTFSAPSPDFLRNQVLIRMISPKLIADAAVGTTAAGTGPYRLAEWNQGREMILEPADEYWGDGPYLERIELRSISDTTTAINALTAGDIDVVMKLPPPQLEGLAANQEIDLHTKESWIEGHLVFRCDVPPLDDVRVRQAIAYALDRGAVVEHVLEGEAVVGASPMPPETYGVVTPETSYERDLDRARGLLAEAGYPDGLDLTMSVFAGIRVMGEEVSQAIVGQLAEAGINVELNILEPGVAILDLTEDEPSNPLVHVEYGWTNGGPFHFTLGNALGHPHYTGQELESLIESIRTEPDGDRRLDLLAETQEAFMEEIPHLPLYHLTLTDATRNNVGGYTNPKDGYFPPLGTAYLKG